MAQSPLAPFPGVGDTSFGQSRVLSLSPHTDGLLLTPAGQLQTSGPGTWALAQSGPGRWAISHTAAAGETQIIRSPLNGFTRIGEPMQQPGNYPPPKPPYPAKGFGVLDIVVAMQVGVVALVGAAVTLLSTTYSKTVAPTVKVILPTTTLPSLTVSAPAAPLIQVVSIPLAAQQFVTADFSTMEIELNLNMAATGTVSIEALGAHIAFNLD